MPSGLAFDVVVANILRGPLVELEPRLSAYGAPGSVLLLSGILTEQVRIQKVVKFGDVHQGSADAHGTSTHRLATTTHGS